MTIAQALEDFFHVLAGRAQNGHHGRGHDETATVIGTFRTRTRTWTPGKCRTNEVSKTLQNIDTHGTTTKHAITGQTIEHRIKSRINDDRCTTGGQYIDHIAITSAFTTIILQSPEQCDKASRSGLQQHWHENVVGTKPYAETSKSCSRILIQTPYFLSHFAALKNTKTFDDLESQAACHTGQSVSSTEISQWLQYGFDMVHDKTFNTGSNLVAC